MEDEQSRRGRESRRDRLERKDRERTPYKGVELVELEPTEAQWLQNTHPPHRQKVWRATMTANGRELFLGLYATAEDAARVHDLGILSFGGAPEDLNFPSG